MRFLCYCFLDEAEVSKSLVDCKTDLALFCKGSLDREGGGFVEGPCRKKNHSRPLRKGYFLCVIPPSP